MRPDAFRVLHVLMFLLSALVFGGLTPVHVVSSHLSVWERALLASPMALQFLVQSILLLRGADEPALVQAERRLTRVTLFVLGLGCLGGGIWSLLRGDRHSALGLLLGSALLLWLGTSRWAYSHFR